VRHGPGWLHSLEPHRNGHRFGLADPDRQRDSLLLVDQQHNRVVLLVESDTANLHQAHGWIPLPAAHGATS